MRASKKAKGVVVYGLYRLAVFVVPWLPRFAVVWLGRRLGTLYFMISRRTREVGRENLARVFPERDDREAILRESMRLQGVAMLDTLWASRLGPAKTEGLVSYSEECAALLLAPVQAKRGRIIATAHYGSWEVFIGLARARESIPPITVIARPLRDARIHRHVEKSRARRGVRLVYRRGGALACFSALRRGELVASVIDMAVAPSEGGAYVDFLGTPALTSGALATLAVRHKAPLLFVVCAPIGKGRRYRLEAHAIDVDFGADDRDAEIHRVLERLNRALEGQIRARPEPWIWTYKRWKYRPTPDRLSYPSYSAWSPAESGGPTTDTD